MIVAPFLKEHIAVLEEQNEKKYPEIHPKFREMLEKNGESFTCFSDNKRILMSSGIVRFWPGRAEAWAIFDKKVGHEFIGLHKAVKRFLEITDVPRIEAVVTSTFEEGNRWAKLLGFKVEAPLMKRYLPGGVDAVLYSRVRES